MRTGGETVPAQAQKRIRPKEFTGFLLNPHKGCATFQRFNGDPLSEGKTWSESGPTAFPPRKYDRVTRRPESHRWK